MRSWARTRARRLRRAWRVVKRETVMVVAREHCHEEYVTIARPSGTWWRVLVRCERLGARWFTEIFDAVDGVSDEIRLFMGNVRDPDRAVTRLLAQWNETTC